MRAIATYGHTIENLGVGLFLIGVALGVATALVGGFNLTAPWLLLAYAIVVALLVLGAAVEGPWRARIMRAVDVSEGGEAGELDRLIASPRGVGALLMSAVLYVAVILVMVAKPFS